MAEKFQGDSGGPLAFIEDDGIPTLIGVVSFGAAAGCEIGLPAGYTRTSSFLDWIAYNSRVEIRP
jgi:secreted trypsin-like serine protease